MTIERFDIAVPQDVLNNLSDRIARTRWPDQISGSGWDYGTDTAYLKGLLSYWGDGFDWRKQEKRINRFEHFRTMIDGLQIHFIHAKSRSGHGIPLLMLHGWPSSFLQMLDILPMLTHPPSGHGSDFEVIIPSLPGFGFSPAPDRSGLNERSCAGIFAHLMHDVLGFDRFAARGSDIGASILQHMARDAPERLLGLHLTGIRPIVGDVPADATARELDFFDEAKRWMARERGYAMMHATRPQTLAHALNDSPAGLASWIIEKFRAWSDCDGDVERRFSRDELLTNLTLYWATGSINSSMRIYYESALDAARTERVEVPTAMLMAPSDLVHPPRSWVERSINVVRWTQMARGGHFPEWEEPAQVATDLRAFFIPPISARLG